MWNLSELLPLRIVLQSDLISLGVLRLLGEHVGIQEEGPRHFANVVVDEAMLRKTESSQLVDVDLVLDRFFRFRILIQFRFLFFFIFRSFLITIHRSPLHTHRLPILPIRPLLRTEIWLQYFHQIVNLLFDFHFFNFRLGKFIVHYLTV